MAVVKMLTCHYWDCPCGLRSYHHGVPYQPTEEDIERIAEREGIDLSQAKPGDLFMVPDEVICTRCGAKHEVVDPAEGGDGQWWDGDGPNPQDLDNEDPSHH